MPSVTAPVDVVTLPELTITEYFGNASTKDAQISAAHVKINAATEEDWQTPEFDEYVLITSGEVHIRHAGGKTVVREGSGVFLRAGLRVKWVFPGPCSYVPICLPAFSPENVNREEGDAAAKAEPEPAAPAAEPAGPEVVAPVDVVAAKDLTITEYFGHVASKDGTLSACLATVSAPCAEAYQAPDFDEYVMVLSGEVHLRQDEGVTVVKEGQAVFLKAGERVKWEWPGACTYVPICLPAFSPANCHREEEAGAAKDKAAMDRLHALHAGDEAAKAPDVQLGA
uniref:(S)-ureidoglycine aminohydrolase cupin domain-containing protein n=1 Tax=Zooxanthella nutricula TaxID=1333877 RepID=A0A7S2I8C3_9DINO